MNKLARILKSNEMVEFIVRTASLLETFSTSLRFLEGISVTSLPFLHVNMQDNRTRPPLSFSIVRTFFSRLAVVLSSQTRNGSILAYSTPSSLLFH